MRKKYIAIIISVILVIVIIIFSNLFLVKTVEVVFEKPPHITNDEEIIAAAKIKMNSNIFNLNEQNIIDNVSNYFDNNKVSITDVQRSFPNKIRLYVKERHPILTIGYGNENGEKCIPTDIDFQLTNHIDKVDIDFTAIAITGTYVSTTFNQPTFQYIRRVLYAYIDLNFNTDSLVSFIKEINVDGNKLILKLRNGESAFEIDAKAELSIEHQVKQLYNEYLGLSYNKRNVFYLKI